MVFVGIVTLAASLVASWLKQFPGFSLFGALIIALLIGMAAQFPIRKWYSSRSMEHINHGGYGKLGGTVPAA